MTAEVVLMRPDDFHAHFRQGEMLRRVLKHTAAVFGRAVVMPNLAQPVRVAADVVRYREEIEQACNDLSCANFQPLMTIYLTDETTPELVIEARRAGAVAAKLYMHGTTTNAHHGVKNLQGLESVFLAMQDAGMILCVHGEWPIGDVMAWESHFLPHLRVLAKEYPRLRIVLEHISSEAAVQCVRALPPTVAATITAHHLQLTHNDIVGWGRIKPHHFCMPIAKAAEDRAALISAAISGSPKFFFGSDTAPHDREQKECASGCAGLFTAPVALPVLAEVFESFDALKNLTAFTSLHGANFYSLPFNTGTVTLVRRPWQVPELIEGIVPFRAGETLAWQVV